MADNTVQAASEYQNARLTHLTNLFAKRFARSTWLLCLLVATAVPMAIAQPSASGSPPEPVGAAVDRATPFSVAARHQVAEALAKALEKGYAHEDIGKQMAQAIRAKIKARAYDRIASREEFAQALQADVRAIANDKHFRVLAQAGPGMMGPPPGAGGPPPDMIAQMRKENGAISRLQILPGNIGYMEVNGVPFKDAAKDAIAAAFAFLHNTDALIIDVRANGGGDPETVAWYMSYLSEGASYTVNVFHDRDGSVEKTRTTHLGDLSYGARKPVYCLISPNTFSGGEELAYDIQAYKRGQLVGEVTGGGANPVEPQPLVHGFSALIPYGYVVHPVTGTNWEGIGVKPDVAVPADQALLEAQRLALQRLSGDATAAEERAAFQVLLLDLQSRAKQQSAGVSQPNRLTHAQVTGSYGRSGADGRPMPSVLEKDGRLYLRHPASGTSIQLIPLGADRYRQAGVPDDFTVTFREMGGKIQMLRNSSGSPHWADKVQ